MLDALAVDPARTLVVLRPPPDVSLYHRHSNPLFPQTLQHLGRLETVHAVVIPRTEEQRDYVRSLALPSVIVPEPAVDAQSLIAYADLVVSAGGTMNREAAALGVPVYTTYGGRLGGVDEELIRQGRLRPLTDPRALELEKRKAGAGERVRRDPAATARATAVGLSGLTDRRRARRRRSGRASPGRRRGRGRARGSSAASRPRSPRATLLWKTMYAGTASLFARVLPPGGERVVELRVGDRSTGVPLGPRAGAGLDAELGEERARAASTSVSASDRRARVIPT